MSSSFLSSSKTLIESYSRGVKAIVDDLFQVGVFSNALPVFDTYNGDSLMRQVESWIKNQEQDRTYDDVRNDSKPDYANILMEVLFQLEQSAFISLGEVTTMDFDSSLTFEQQCAVFVYAVLVHHPLIRQPVFPWLKLYMSERYETEMIPSENVVEFLRGYKPTEYKTSVRSDAVPPYVHGVRFIGKSHFTPHPLYETVLDQLDKTPAFVQAAVYQVLECNQGQEPDVSMEEIMESIAAYQKAGKATGTTTTTTTATVTASATKASTVRMEKEEEEEDSSKKPKVKKESFSSNDNKSGERGDIIHSDSSDMADLFSDSEEEEEEEKGKPVSTQQKKKKVSSKTQKVCPLCSEPLDPEDLKEVNTVCNHCKEQFHMGCLLLDGINPAEDPDWLCDECIEDDDFLVSENEEEEAILLDEEFREFQEAMAYGRNKGIEAEKSEKDPEDNPMTGSLQKIVFANSKKFEDVTKAIEAGLTHSDGFVTEPLSKREKTVMDQLVEKQELKNKKGKGKGGLSGLPLSDASGAGAEGMETTGLVSASVVKPPPKKRVVPTPVILQPTTPSSSSSAMLQNPLSVSHSFVSVPSVLKTPEKKPPVVSLVSSDEEGDDKKDSDDDVLGFYPFGKKKEVPMNCGGNGSAQDSAKRRAQQKDHGDG
jgi:hypothetical protein